MDTIEAISQEMANKVNLAGMIERANRQALCTDVGAVCVFGKVLGMDDRRPVWHYWTATVSPHEIGRYLDHAPPGGGRALLLYATTQVAQRALLE